MWRADALAQATPARVEPSGLGVVLDALLPGGRWPFGQLTEVISREAGVGEMRLVLPVLVRTTRAGGLAMLVSPPHVPHVPHAAALVHHGVDLDKVIVVQAGPAEATWAVEQAIRSDALGLVLGWAPPGPLAASRLRRLALAATEARSTVSIVFRGWPALYAASPAPLRLTVEPSAEAASLGAIKVHIVKRRGTPSRRQCSWWRRSTPKALFAELGEPLRDAGWPTRCLWPPTRSARQPRTWAFGLPEAEPQPPEVLSTPKSAESLGYGRRTHSCRAGRVAAPGARCPWRGDLIHRPQPHRTLGRRSASPLML